MRDDQALTPPGGGTHVEPWLDAYRTGELGEAERLRVERHLERCPACAARLAEIESFGRLVGRGFATAAAHPAARAPDWDRQRREILARTVGPRPAERRRAPFLRWAPQAALAVLGLLVLGILVRQNMNPLQRRYESGKGFPRSASEPRPAAERARAAGDSEPARESPDSGRSLQAPALGREDQALSSDVRPESQEETSTARSAAPARPDQAAALDRVAGGFVGPPEARQAPADLPTGAAGAPVVPEETFKARAKGELEGQAALRANERKQAVVSNEPAPGKVADADKEADVGGAGRRAETPSLGAADSESLADEIAPSGGEAAQREVAPAEMDPLQRLDLYARKALASRDSLDVRRALAFWRDSVAVREDLDAARKRAAAALVDSLAREIP